MKSFERQFAVMISMIDSAVFPDQAFKIWLVDEPPPVGKPQFSFAYNVKDPGESFYLVYAGLMRYFEAGRASSIHAMLEPEALIRAQGKDVLQFTNDEIFLGAALHEVRHRMQYCLNIPMFNERHTSQVLRCRFWGEVQAKHYRNIPGGDQEFDAKFFECYGAHELRQGRLKLNPKDLGNLMRMTVEEFLEKEKRI